MSRIAWQGSPLQTNHQVDAVVEELVLFPLAGKVPAWGPGFDVDKQLFSTAGIAEQPATSHRKEQKPFPTAAQKAKD